MIEQEAISRVFFSIHETIDFDASEVEGRTVICSGVDQEVDRLRSEYSNLEQLLSQIAREMTDRLDLWPTPCINVVYFPQHKCESLMSHTQLGYLIAIASASSGTVDGQVESLLTLELLFETEAFRYYKNPRMRELDDSVGDLHSMIVDSELRVVQALQDGILVHKHTMREALEALSELDCAMSLAEAAQRYGYIRPELSSDPVLVVHNGRHPLLEQSVGTFVSNSTILDASGGRPASAPVMLLMGANFSGKSVYMSQIGLITFMAHIGSFVPADAALIGITDKILTRMETRESQSRNCSSFLLDAYQALQCLRLSTHRSLILIDEFGKGTLTTDGAGLFCGILKHLTQRAQSCPRAVAITHFHEIMSKNLLSSEISLGSVSCHHMHIMQNPTRTTEGIVYLYKVTPGPPLSSCGIHCAKLAGLPGSVTDRGMSDSAASCIALR
ncbi:muts domain V-domain-containing protein [Polychytrium aggregatum]|uniref:muts domain V-domain-containing protein n=1 Tax=Polychytrium aggregatum TaxID=110093 RepID=UPI0022FEEC4B|nr:muts domain V-domain-containing protein [Polychytrium aggregatum]KAI9203901.1 muts domain V-domain-containing protein [Polychytrium aggregatum]